MLQSTICRYTRIINTSRTLYRIPKSVTTAAHNARLLYRCTRAASCTCAHIYIPTHAVVVYVYVIGTRCESAWRRATKWQKRFGPRLSLSRETWAVHGPHISTTCCCCCSCRCRNVVVAGTLYAQKYAYI